MAATITISCFLRLLFVSLVVVLISGSFVTPVLGKKFLSARRVARNQEEFPVGKPLRPKPNLLFRKTFLNKVFAIGWKIFVKYEIYNVGDHPALDVSVIDEDFAPTSKFDIVNGESKFQIGRLLPGKNETFNITVLPNILRIQLGILQFQPAKITYRSSDVEMYEIVDDDEGEIIGWSSLSPFHDGKVQLLSKRDADRRFGNKTLDILLLILLAVPPVFVPMVLWRLHVHKYNNLQRLKDATKSTKKLNLKKQI